MVGEVSDKEWIFLVIATMNRSRTVKRSCTCRQHGWLDQPLSPRSRSRHTGVSVMEAMTHGITGLRQAEGQSDLAVRTHDRPLADPISAKEYSR